MAAPKIYTVSQISSYVDQMFRNDYFLSGRIYVEGEISTKNFYPRYNMLFFTVKDAQTVLSCVMYANDGAPRWNASLNKGQKVTLFGEIRSVARNDSKYQMIVRGVQLKGTGDYHEQYMKLWHELNARGYFDPYTKKKIPAFVHTLGVVTSPSGAVVHDIIHVAKQRHPGIRILVYPAKVMGDGAPETLAAGIEAMQQAGVDVILIGRGGGSREDLIAFDDRLVAEAIHNSRIPVISAVGHETDKTIADLTADATENAPSTAAVLAVPEIAVLQEELLQIREDLYESMQRRILFEQQRLAGMSMKLELCSPLQRLENQKQNLEASRAALERQMQQHLERSRTKLALIRERLEGASPYRKLEAGYALVTDDQGKRVTGVQKLQPGMKLTVRFADGRAQALVQDVGVQPKGIPE